MKAECSHSTAPMGILVSITLSCYSVAVLLIQYISSTVRCQAFSCIPSLARDNSTIMDYVALLRCCCRAYLVYQLYSSLSRESFQSRLHLLDALCCASCLLSKYTSYTVACQHLILSRCCSTVPSKYSIDMFCCQEGNLPAWLLLLVARCGVSLACFTSISVVQLIVNN